MVNRIVQDLNQFNRKLGRLKEEGLREYFSQDGFLLPQSDGSTVKIPIRTLEIPRLRLGDNSGVGQGEGEVGDVLSEGQGRPGQEGQGKQSGHGYGERIYAELSLEEAADRLGDELELPNLLETFTGAMDVESTRRYSGITDVGPESLRHLKRTYQQALKREIGSGTWYPGKPIVPIPPDKRFRTAKEDTTPATNALIVYLLDRSGSMDDVITFHQNVGWWATAWLKKHYKGVVQRYIQYDSRAEEVRAEDFFTIQAGGGTRMKAGLNLAKQIIEEEYPVNQWNVYLVHFTDGDCHGMEFSKEEMDHYAGLADEFPDLGIFADIFQDTKTPNPLTTYLIPRCNAVFVCEAGDWSSGAGTSRYKVSGVNLRGSYAGMLNRFERKWPGIHSKLRWVSYRTDDVYSKSGELLHDTLQEWFT